MHRRVVKETEAQDFVKTTIQSKAEYFEISAKSGIGVNAMFKRAAEVLLDKVVSGAIDSAAYDVI